MEMLGLVLAAFMGLSLGMLGGGGSILTVPIFVYVLGFDAKTAIAMSLPVVGITSLAAAIGHWRAGNVNLRAAFLFGAIAMVGALAGSWLAAYLTGAAQLVLLGTAMLAAAVAMLRGSDRETTPAATPGTAPTMPFVSLTMVALGVGVLTGVVGIGGGFLIVPALVLLARLPMKFAVGTSLLVIAMNAASGFAGYVGQVDIAWRAILLFTAIAIAGALAGSHLVRFVPQATLKRGFAVFLLVLGALILYQNRFALTQPRAHDRADGAASTRTASHLEND